MKKNTDLQKIGNYIKELREKKNLSQKDLADKLQLDNKTVSKWERGTSAVDITYLVKLADVLSTTPEEILLGSNNPNDIKKSKLIEYVKKEKIRVFIIFIILLSVISLTSIITINKIKRDNQIDYYDIHAQGNFQIEGYIINNNKKSFLIINKIIDEKEMTDYIYKVHVIINGKENTKFTYDEDDKLNISEFHCSIIIDEKIDFTQKNAIIVEYYKDDELDVDYTQILN